MALNEKQTQWMKKVLKTEKTVETWSNKEVRGFLVKCRERGVFVDNKLSMREKKQLIRRWGVEMGIWEPQDQNVTVNAEGPEGAIELNDPQEREKEKAEMKQKWEEVKAIARDAQSWEYARMYVAEAATYILSSGKVTEPEEATRLLRAAHVRDVQDALAMEEAEWEEVKKDWPSFQGAFAKAWNLLSKEGETRPRKKAEMAAWIQTAGLVTGKDAHEVRKEMVADEQFARYEADEALGEALYQLGARVPPMKGVHKYWSANGFLPARLTSEQLAGLRELGAAEIEKILVQSGVSPSVFWEAGLVEKKAVATKPAEIKTKTVWIEKQSEESDEMVSTDSTDSTNNDAGESVEKKEEVVMDDNAKAEETVKIETAAEKEPDSASEPKPEEVKKGLWASMKRKVLGDQQLRGLQKAIAIVGSGDGEGLFREGYFPPLMSLMDAVIEAAGLGDAHISVVAKKVSAVEEARPSAFAAMGLILFVAGEDRDTQVSELLKTSWDDSGEGVKHKLKGLSSRRSDRRVIAEAVIDALRGVEWTEQEQEFFSELLKSKKGRIARLKEAAKEAAAKVRKVRIFDTNNDAGESVEEPVEGKEETVDDKKQQEAVEEPKGLFRKIWGGLKKVAGQVVGVVKTSAKKAAAWLKENKDLAVLTLVNFIQGFSAGTIGAAVTAKIGVGGIVGFGILVAASLVAFLVIKKLEALMIGGVNVVRMRRDLNTQE